jgi:hypothetical protein
LIGSEFFRARRPMRRVINSDVWTSCPREGTIIHSAECHHSGGGIR